jgi:hypothetical protein
MILSLASEAVRHGGLWSNSPRLIRRAIIGPMRQRTRPFAALLASIVLAGCNRSPQAVAD